MLCGLLRRFSGHTTVFLRGAGQVTLPSPADRLCSLKSAGRGTARNGTVYVDVIAVSRQGLVQRYDVAVSSACNEEPGSQQKVVQSGVSLCKVRLTWRGCVFFLDCCCIHDNDVSNAACHLGLAVLSRFLALLAGLRLLLSLARGFALRAPAAPVTSLRLSPPLGRNSIPVTGWYVAPNVRNAHAILSH